MDKMKTFMLEWICFIICWKNGHVDSCVFPYFLWQDKENSEQKVWLTKITYISNSKTWESRLKIVASSQKFTTSSEIPWLCEEDETPYQLNPGKINRRPCVKSSAITYTQCTAVEGSSKYRVLITNVNNGKEKFTCMKFIRRNENAVDIIQTRPSDVDGIDLCSEDQLTRSEWPWIAQVLQHPVTCPLVGGFDFDGFMNHKLKKLCFRVWRPSRIESECLLGEGYRFTFPERTCSFFQDRKTEVNLICWAWWQENNWINVLASEAGDSPQFALMLPNDHLDTLSTKSGRFYFSPVFPTAKNGIPPDGIMHINMDIKRSAKENCYDESIKCEQFAREGKCSNDGFYYFGNYCKKSCGLCDFVPNTTPECNFPMNYQGDWILFQTNQKETVTIIGGKVTFSKMGTFICKSKHWSEPYFKLLSVYKNGCRPRYTCIQLEYSEDTGFLKLNLSPSNMVDYSFDLCDFKDDSLKILYPIPQISLFSCGLGGFVELQALILGRDSCRGTLADWNPFSCNIVPTLTLTLRACKHEGVEIYREFTCEAHIDMKNNNKILLTKELTSDSLDYPQYQCWLIKTYPVSDNSTSSKAPWKHAYLLKRAQCGGDGDLDPEIYKPTEAIFQMYSDTAEKHCVQKGQSSDVDKIKKPAYRYNRNSKHTDKLPHIPQFDNFISNSQNSLQLSSKQLLYIQIWTMALTLYQKLI